MDQKKTGALIRVLRLEQRQTQRQLASALGVSDSAVSKWERGLGCPDVSLLPGLSTALGVDLAGLLAGGLPENDHFGGSMKNIQFYICPQCGNLITTTGDACVSCCGRLLTPQAVQKPDPAHTLDIHPVEDEWFVTTHHPMEKEHYITFVALITAERSLIAKCWPEWELQQRLPRRGHGMLYWYCTQHGLFRQLL